MLLGSLMQDEALLSVALLSVRSMQPVHQAVLRWARSGHQAQERDATWPSAASAAGPSAAPAAAAPAPPRASQARPPRSSSSAPAFVLRSSAYEAHASSCSRRSRLFNQ